MPSLMPQGGQNSLRGSGPRIYSSRVLEGCVLPADGDRAPLLFSAPLTRAHARRLASALAPRRPTATGSTTAS